MQVNRTLGLFSATLFLFALTTATVPARAQGTITVIAGPLDGPGPNTNQNIVALIAGAGPISGPNPGPTTQGSINIQTPGTGTLPSLPSTLTALQNGGATLNLSTSSGGGGFAVTTFGGSVSAGTINISGVNGLGATSGNITLQAAGIAPGRGAIAPIFNPPILPQLPVKTETTNSAARFAPAVTPQTVESAFPNFGVPTDRIMWGFKVRSTTGETKTPPLVTTNVGRVLPNMVAENNPIFSLRQDGTAEYKVTGPIIDLTKGSILIVTHKPVEVRCGSTTVSLDSGSVVEISSSSDGLYVRTLMNDHNRGVAVSIDGQVRHVGVGSELCVAANQQGISDILRDRIPRRHEYWQKLSDGKILWTSNVSLAHLVGADAVLVTMYRHGGADKSMATKVHKMAAAQFYSSWKRAPYRVIDPSQKISLAP